MSKTALAMLTSRCGQRWLLPDAPGQNLLLFPPASRNAHIPGLAAPPHLQSQQPHLSCLCFLITPPLFLILWPPTFSEKAPLSH